MRASLLEGEAIVFAMSNLNFQNCKVGAIAPTCWFWYSGVIAKFLKEVV